MIEAIHHGVPMVGLPVWADQGANCILMEHKEVGVALDKKTVDEDAIYQAIVKVREDER